MISEVAKQTFKNFLKYKKRIQNRSRRMKRQEGFYWVKYQGRWEIAEWQKGYWWNTGGEDSAEDNEFEDINEMRIEEPKAIRKAGFYWAKWYGNDTWGVAYWDGTEWDQDGNIYEDSDFEEIDENRIERKS